MLHKFFVAKHWHGPRLKILVSCNKILLSSMTGRFNNKLDRLLNHPTEKGKLQRTLQFPAQDIPLSLIKLESRLFQTLPEDWERIRTNPLLRNNYLSGCLSCKLNAGIGGNQILSLVSSHNHCKGTNSRVTVLRANTSHYGAVSERTVSDVLFIIAIYSLKFCLVIFVWFFGMELKKYQSEVANTLLLTVVLFMVVPMIICIMSPFFLMWCN